MHGINTDTTSNNARRFDLIEGRALSEKRRSIMTDVSIVCERGNAPSDEERDVVEQAIEDVLQRLSMRWQDICKRVRVQYCGNHTLPVWDIYFLFQPDKGPEIAASFTTRNMGWPRHHWVWDNFTAEQLTAKIFDGFHKPATSEHFLGIEAKLELKVAEFLKKGTKSKRVLERLSPKSAGLEVVPILDRRYFALHLVRPKEDITLAELKDLLIEEAYDLHVRSDWEMLLADENYRDVDLCVLEPSGTSSNWEVSYRRGGEEQNGYPFNPQRSWQDQAGIQTYLVVGRPLGEGG